MIHARFLPKYPKRINVTDGLTKTEANGVVTLGFDYVNSEVGAELQQTVDATAANVALTAADRTAVAADLVAANAAAATATSAVSLFGTKALAAAATPVSASQFILTEGAATVGDGGGTLYKNNGTTTGDLVITLSDGTTLVGYDVSGPVINAAGCGLAPTATGAVNLAALKKAVSLCPVGGEVWIPPQGGVCTVDTSGGLSDAVLIDKTITFRNDGHLKMSTTADLVSNPAFLFKVTADYVKFHGAGTFEGDGNAYIAAGAGDETFFPGIVYVLAADYFKFEGIRLLKPPKIGIYLRGSYHGSLKDFVIEGGYVGGQPSVILDPSDPNFGDANPAYIGSYNVGVTLTGGAYHRLSKITSLPGTDGGSVSILSFSGGSGGVANQCVMSQCTAVRPWEKVAYWYGANHKILNCQVEGSFVAYQTSGFTDAIRVWGANNLVQGNIVNNCKGGVQALDGSGNKIYDNRFSSCSGVAINVQHFESSYLGNISQNEVCRNFVSHNGVTPAPTAGILFYSAFADFTHIKCDGNTVQGYGMDTSYGAIHVEGASGVAAYQPALNGNNIISYTTGIKIKSGVEVKISCTDLRVGTHTGVLLDSCTGGDISGTTGLSVGAWALGLTNSTGLCFHDNNTRDAVNIGISGLVFGSNSNYGYDNQYTVKPLIGVATLSASATTTIIHGGVEPNATIQYFLTDGSFATLCDTSGFYTGPNAGDFNIVRASGAAPAGTETFRYRIIQ